MFNKPRSDRRVVTVLMYHGLETDPARLACNDLDITPESCLDEIRFYQQQGYRLIPADDLDGLGDRADGPAYLIVSFDDGHRNTFAHIQRWLTEERIPVMLAICPDIVERQGLFWWEEVRARFDLMTADAVDLEVDGVHLRFSRQEARRLEERCRSVPHHLLLSLLDQLRRQTDDVRDDQIGASRYVHENMNWEQVRALAAHPLCVLASHSLAHEIATNLSERQLRENAQKSREMIRQHTGQAVRHYAYANGICSEQTDAVLFQCGFSYTYSTVGATNPVDDLTDAMGVRLNRFHGFGFQRDRVEQFARTWNQRHGV